MLLPLPPPELEEEEDDEEADPLDDGRPLSPLPALRDLRTAALPAIPEGRRLDDEEGRPPVRDVDDLEDEAGLPAEGVEDEQVDRRFSGAEARGILVCSLLIAWWGWIALPCLWVVACGGSRLSISSRLLSVWLLSVSLGPTCTVFQTNDNFEWPVFC